jgi:hypothetical protein
MIQVEDAGSYKYPKVLCSLVPTSLREYLIARRIKEKLFAKKAPKKGAFKLSAEEGKTTSNKPGF